jgi:hypothetical protein
VVIVADYQHVEAEENLELLRMFVDEGKPLAFVVNQIDKHLDVELPFERFVQSVEEVLADYGVEEARIFFTSTLQTPHNQIDELEAWLLGFAEDEASGSDALERKLFDVAKAAIWDWAAPEIDAAAASVRAYFGYVPMSDEEASHMADQARQRWTEAQAKWEDARQADERRRQTIREKWMRLVELAQIAPYETTEKGRMYIESLRPDFKVGFFRAQKKTEDARRQFAEAFAEDLRTRVDNYLLIPLRNQVSDDIRREAELPADVQQSFVDQVTAVQVDVDLPFVEQQVKQGALVSSQYPYQYVKDVVGKIKRLVLGQLTPIADAWMERAEKAFEEAHEALREEVELAQKRYEAIDRLLEERQRVQHVIDSVAAGEVPSR